MLPGSSWWLSDTWHKRERRLSYRPVVNSSECDDSAECWIESPELNYKHTETTSDDGTLPGDFTCCTFVTWWSVELLGERTMMGRGGCSRHGDPLWTDSKESLWMRPHPRPPTARHQTCTHIRSIFRCLELYKDPGSVLTVQTINVKKTTNRLLKPPGSLSTVFTTQITVTMRDAPLLDYIS